MKNIIIIIVELLVILFITYLVISFVIWDMDIIHWNNDSRGALVCFSGISFILYKTYETW